MKIKLNDAIIIGFFQVLSLIPGKVDQNYYQSARILKLKDMMRQKYLFIINTHFRSCFIFGLKI